MLDLVMPWILARLNEVTTWTGLLTAIGAKLGLAFVPQFDTLVVNAALAIVAIAAYTIKGGPVIIPKK